MKQVRVAHHRMNSDSRSKTHQALETQHLLRLGLAHQTQKKTVIPGSADGAAKARAAVSNQRREASADRLGLSRSQAHEFEILGHKDPVMPYSHHRQTAQDHASGRGQQQRPSNSIGCKSIGCKSIG